MRDTIVYGTMSGGILDPLKVEEGRLRELELVSEHSMCGLENNVDARGGAHVHAKWLQDHSGDEVRCRLVATPLAHR